MGRRRKGRAINGIFLLNKDVGGSSNQVLQQIRRIFGAAKAGHTGALDPLASGMLPICLGEATKFSQFLLDADKVYETTATLGIRTTTSDADGDVVEEKPVNVTSEQLVQVCNSFKGHTQQIASMFSALKYQGKPYYYYARQGLEVPREPRDVHIYALDILRFSGNEVDLRVHCSKGTYIRSLVDDIGQQLGCGAYVTRLHRTAVADYPADNMLTIDTLKSMAESQLQGDYTELDKLLLPMDTAVAALPKVHIEAGAAGYFCNGNPVQLYPKRTIEDDGQVVRAYCGERFLGVATIQECMLAPKRLVV